MATAPQVDHPLSRTRRIVAWLAALALVGVAVPMLARAFGWEAGPLAYVVALTPWWTLACAVVLGLSLVARAWWVAGPSGALLALGVAWIAPVFIADSSDTDPNGPELVVASVSAGFGLVDADAVVALVRDADIDLLAVQELTPECAEALETAGLFETLPFAELHPAEGFTGTGLYSSLPLADARGVDGMTSWLVEARVETAAGPLTVVAPHPAAPGPTGHAAWSSDLDALQELVADTDGPLLVLGDLNATRDHRAFRELEAAGLVDARDQAGAGIHLTFPQGRELFPLVAIDHALTRDAPWVATGVETVALPGSDHRALVVTYASASANTSDG